MTRDRRSRSQMLDVLRLLLEVDSDEILDKSEAEVEAILDELNIDSTHHLSLIIDKHNTFQKGRQNLRHIQQYLNL